MIKHQHFLMVQNPLRTVDVKVRGSALKRAELVIESALRWLESTAGTPCFLFIHFFDAHWPYEPPRLVVENVANPYEGEVAYADHYLGMFIVSRASRTP